MLSRFLAATVGICLAWFTIRRLLLLAAALAPPRAIRGDASTALPAIALAIPAHNEQDALPELLPALESLDYPPEKLTVVFVCDGCTDATADRLREWADDRAHVRVVELPRRVGKAAALNEALAHSETDLLVVLDADLRPRPDFLRQLVSAFTDTRVAASTGLLNPVNATETVISRYCALDAWVNQLVVAAGKDRLYLNPPTFGASAYRRDALAEIGGFWGVQSGEDVEAALALERAGWRTRFAPQAVADNTVTATAADYWHQHVRWARGNLDARNARQLPFEGRFVDRLEAWTVAAGYLDRVLFLVAVPLAVAQRFPRRLVAAYLAVPAAEVVAAVVKAGAGRRLPGFMFAALVVFPLDLAASAAAMSAHLARRPREWQSPRTRTAELADQNVRSR
jgi:cellulose synthase/poly-beta-1,6-N-acetylglucosamine synthase-like glycosyltransferase